MLHSCMKFFATAKWVNRHSSSLILAAFLLLLCGVTHIMVLARMDFVKRQFPIMNLRTERSMAIIDFLNGNRLIAWVFIIAFISSLLCLELRAAPRWLVWLVFFSFAAPCGAYWMICAYIGGSSRSRCPHLLKPLSIRCDHRWHTC